MEARRGFEDCALDPGGESGRDDREEPVRRSMRIGVTPLRLVVLVSSLLMSPDITLSISNVTNALCKYGARG